MSKTELNTLAYNELSNSDKGKQLRAQAAADAATFLFDLGSGALNEEVKKVLSPAEIYSAVLLSSSLTINVNNQEYTLVPLYENLNEDNVLGMLQDLQERIAESLLNAVLMERSEHMKEYLPGATTMEILDVCMLDIVEEYDTPDNVPEWKWVESEACYNHGKNGTDGIWEFIVNMSCYSSHDNPAPEKLLPVIDAAKKQGVGYILFHQGT